MEKLRKALERAKQESVDEKETLPGREAPTAVSSENRLRQVLPVYTQSRSFGLDLETLADNRCVGVSPDSLEIEFYKMLRTQILQRTSPNGWNTIMITSAMPGEGKTLTAVNLALTFAKEFNHTVLLVDCDLRHQNVHKVLGIESEQGLIDALINNRPLQELIIWPGIEKLTLISGGRTISNTSEILSSTKMKALVSEIKYRYHDRYIFFDVPPILSVADPVAFAPLVDAILMVVQADKTSIQDIKKALDLIPKEKFLGFVLNRDKAPIRAYSGADYAKAS